MSDLSWARVVEDHSGYETQVGTYVGHFLKRNPRGLLFSLSRYKFAQKMIPPGSSVLELGCNEGLGANLLSEIGNLVIGVDFDQRAIDSARRVFVDFEGLGVPKLDFLCDDFLGKRYGEFDAVVSLDVIEHITEEEIFMQTIIKNLRPGGICVIGTPNETAKEYASEGSKRGHVNLFDGGRLKSLVSRYFRNTFLFGMNDEVVHTGFTPMSHYLMIVGSTPKVS